MKNRISLLLLSLEFLGLVLLVSCYSRDESNVNAGCNDGCITFYGRISTNEHSDSPVHNAYLELGWSEPNFTLSNLGRLIATRYSDKDGYYSIKFKPREKELVRGQFYIDVFKDGYFDSSYSDYSIEKIDTSYNINFHLASMTRLEVIMKNFNPQDEDDKFYINSTYNPYGRKHKFVKMSEANGGIDNTYYDFKDGSFAEKRFVGLTAGNQYTYFDIGIKKNGELFERRDSIFVKRREKGVYEVEY